MTFLKKTADEVPTGSDRSTLVDCPADKDLLGMDGYVDGLATYIETCATPMTIAIQGSWGTGKSSIMKMVNARFDKKKIKVIKFDTWQYSQFNMDDYLAVSFINLLVDEMSKDTKDFKDSQSVKDIAASVKKGLCFASRLLAAMTGSSIEVFSDSETEDTPVKPDDIAKMKEDFQKLVNNYCKSTERDRVVIFVDDLDRLAPRKAIELLEVLKLFLDCEHCVYVLAIDYGVVLSGFAEKYGESADRLGDRKGRQFFDKIIQVPFMVPVAEYHMENYVEQCFSEAGIDIAKIAGEEGGFGVDFYTELIEYTVATSKRKGSNPRSVKRLFNLFLLLKNVTEASGQDVALGEEDSPESIRRLFSVICLEYFRSDHDNALYISISGNPDALTLDNLRVLRDGAAEKIEAIDGFSTLGVAEDDESVDLIHGFMKRFLQGVGISLEAAAVAADTDSLAKLKAILEHSRITASPDAVSQASVSLNDVCPEETIVGFRKEVESALEGQQLVWKEVGTAYDPCVDCSLQRGSQTFRVSGYGKKDNGGYLHVRFLGHPDGHKKYANYGKSTEEDNDFHMKLKAFAKLINS